MVKSGLKVDTLLQARKKHFGYPLKGVGWWNKGQLPTKIVLKFDKGSVQQHLNPKILYISHIILYYIILNYIILY